MIASEYGDNICAARLVFRGNCPGHLLPTLIPFRCPSTPSPHLSYSNSCNSAQCSVFTTRPMRSFPSVSLRSTPPTSPFIQCFATPAGISRVGSDLAIIDTAHPPPEPTLYPSSDLFDGWFGIPFLDRDCITHVRIPRLSEIFKLYITYPPRLYNPYPVSQVLLHALSVFTSSRSTRLTPWLPQSLTILSLPRVI